MAHSSYSRKSRDRKTLLDAKNAIRGAMSNKAAIGKVLTKELQKLSTEAYGDFFDWLKRYPGTNISPRQPATDYSDLFPRSIAAPNLVLPSIYWVSLFIRDRSDEINEGLVLTRRFENAFLKGDQDGAAQALDDYRQRFGISIWWIEASISYTSYTKGLDAQKDLAKRIHAEAPNTFASFFAHYVSQRNEPSVSLSRFTDRVTRSIETQRTSKNVKSLLRLLLLGENLRDDNSLTDVASCITTMRSLDAYQIFIQLLTSMCCFEICRNEWPQLADVLSDTGVDDWVLDNLIGVLGGKLKLAHPASLTALDSLFAGDFRSSINCCTATIRETGPSATLVATLAEAMALADCDAETLDVPSLVKDLVRPLSTIQRRRAGTGAAVAELEKLLLNMRPLSIAQALRGHFAQIWQDLPVGGLSTGTMSFLYEAQLAPVHALALPKSLAAECISRLQDKSSLSVALVQAVLEGTVHSVHAHPGLRREFEIISAMRRGNYELGKALSGQIVWEGNEVWSRRAARLSVATNVESGDFLGSITTMAAICCADDDMRFFLPLRRVLQGRRWRELAQYSSNIALPIVLDLYVRTVSDGDHETNRRIAYEEFLISNGCVRPTELGTEAFDRGQIIYFLHRVCLPQVMDVSYAVFTSSREVEEERIKICARLAELDPSSAALYNAEIIERTKICSIQDGLKDIDRSRVHVNTTAIVQWAQNELREEFDRLKQLSISGISISSSDIIKAVTAALEGESDPDEVQQFLVYPDDEAGSILVGLIKDLEYEYLTNKDHGLDAFLSMRIRHGSLAGHLRGPVEESHLVTARNSDTGAYEDNSHWEQELSPLSAEGRKRLQDSLRAFSRSYDAVLETLTKEKLQIRSTLKPKGMFDPAPNPVLIHLLRGQIAELTFDQFITGALHMVESKLQNSLAEVHSAIVGEVKIEIEAAFDALTAELESFLPPRAFGRVSDSIARTSPEVQAALVRVAEWFAPSKSRSESSYSINDVIDIALAATKSAFHGFEPIIRRDVQDVRMLAADTLSVLADILFIIFGNISTHAKVEQPAVAITVRDDPITTNQSALSIRVESQVADSKCTDGELRKLERIRQSLDTDDFQRRVNLEGGTGFLKLWRAVRRDPGKRLTFGYQDTSTFFVEVCLTLFSSGDQEVNNAESFTS